MMALACQYGLFSATKDFEVKSWPAATLDKGLPCVKQSRAYDVIIPFL
jgi:hypothetical protein